MIDWFIDLLINLAIRRLLQPWIAVQADVIPVRIKVQRFCRTRRESVFLAVHLCVCIIMCSMLSCIVWWWWFNVVDFGRRVRLWCACPGNFSTGGDVGIYICSDVSPWFWPQRSGLGPKVNAKILADWPVVDLQIVPFCLCLPKC